MVADDLRVHKVAQVDGGVLPLDESALGKPLKAVLPVPLRDKALIKFIMKPKQPSIHYARRLHRLDDRTLEVGTRLTDDGMRQFYFKDVTLNLEAEAQIPQPDLGQGLVLMDKQDRWMSFTSPLVEMAGVSPESLERTLHDLSHDQLREFGESLIAFHLDPELDSVETVTQVGLRNGKTVARVMEEGATHRTVLYLDEQVAVPRREREQRRYMDSTRLSEVVRDRLTMRMKEVGKIVGRRVLREDRLTDRLEIDTELPEIDIEQIIHKAKWAGYLRALARRYRMEHGYTDEWMKEQRAAGIVPECKGKLDRRYDPVILFYHFPDFGTWYPKHPMEDIEVVAHTLDAAYDELAGIESIARILKQEKRNIAQFKALHSKEQLLEEARDAVSRLEQLDFRAPEEITMQDPRICQELARAAAKTGPNMMLTIHQVRFEKKTTFQLLRFLGTGRYTGYQDVDSKRRELDRKLDSYSAQRMEEALEDPEMREIHFEARGYDVHGEALPQKKGKPKPKAEEPERQRDPEYEAALARFKKRNPEAVEAEARATKQREYKRGEAPEERKKGFRKTKEKKDHDSKVERLRRRFGNNPLAEDN